MINNVTIIESEGEKMDDRFIRLIITKISCPFGKDFHYLFLEIEKEKKL